MANEEETPEFSRIVDLRAVDTRMWHLVASEAEMAALAQRFGLVAIGRLEAEISLTKDGEMVDASGTLEAEIVQACAVTGDDLPVAVREALAFRFIPDGQDHAAPDEEIELEADELDQIPYRDGRFDLGEAVAETLALAIDPYAVGPTAEAVRKQAGLLDEASAGPFAALAALKRNPD